MTNNSSRVRRRLWVMIMYMGLCGWTILSLAIGLPSLQDAIPAWVVYFGILSLAAVGAVGFLFTLATSTHVSHGLKASTEPQNRTLDERQRKVWDRAIRKAYIIVLCILLVLTIHWSFIWPLFSVIDEEIMGLLSLAIFLLALSLPNAIVAWTHLEPED